MDISFTGVVVIIIIKYIKYNIIYGNFQFFFLLKKGFSDIYTRIWV